MKIIIDTVQFASAIASVIGACAKRSPAPFASSVRLRASGEVLTITATDGETRGEKSIAAMVEEPGEFIVDAHRIAATVKTISTPTLTIKADDDAASIVAGSAKFRVLSSMLAQDYPAPIAFDKATEHAYPAAALEFVFKAARPCMSTETSRYAIHGLLAVFGDQKIRAVATDGRRLAVVGPEFTPKARAILPANVVGEVLKAIGDAEPDDQVGVRVSDTRIEFKVGDWTISAPHVAGQFPPYAKIVKGLGTPTATITGDPEALLQAIKAASIFADEAAPGVTITVGDHVEVTASAAEVGSAEIVTECTHTGKGSIKVNGRFLADALAVRDAESSIEIVAPNKPMSVRAREYLCVIMPISHA